MVLYKTLKVRVYGIMIGMEGWVNGGMEGIFKKEKNHGGR
jgi:hypothetical protein